MDAPAAGPGPFTIAATANAKAREGVSASAVSGITTIVLDLGTPSTTEFTSGNNGPATNAYLGVASGSVLRAGHGLRHEPEPGPSPSRSTSRSPAPMAGMSENVVVTETGTNTGIFAGCINATTNIGGAFGGGTLIAPAGSVLTATFDGYEQFPAFHSSATATGACRPPATPAISVTKTIVSPSGGQCRRRPAGHIQSQRGRTPAAPSLPSVSLTDTFTSNRLTFVSASVTPNTTNGNTLVWSNLLGTPSASASPPTSRSRSPRAPIPAPRPTPSSPMATPRPIPPPSPSP